MTKARGITLAVLATLALAAAVPAAAVIAKANLGLTPTNAACDGRFSYGYTLAWQSTPGAAFQVNSGNACHIGSAVCGVSNPDCNVTCSATGQCSTKTSACQIGHGTPWVKVVAKNGSVYQQVAAAAPSRCMQ